MKKCGNKSYMIHSKFDEELPLKFKKLARDDQIHKLHVDCSNLGNEFPYETIFNEKSVKSLVLETPTKNTPSLKFLENNTSLENITIFFQRDVEKENLKSLQKLINNSHALKTLFISSYPSSTLLNLNDFLDGLNGKYSLTDLTLEMKGFIVDYEAFQKLKPLKSFSFQIPKFNVEKFLTNISSQYLPSLKKLEVELQLINGIDLDFSTTSIESFTFRISDYDQNSTNSVFKGLKKIVNLKSLNLDISESIPNDLLCRDYVVSLKEILSHCLYLEELYLTNFSFNENEMKIFFQGLEMTKSLSKFTFQNKSHFKMEKELGRILKSKNLLKHLSIYNWQTNNFDLEEFMLEFQDITSIEHFYVQNCPLENEIGKLFSKFISNNRNLSILSIKNKLSKKDLELMSECIESHTKLTNLNIQIQSPVEEFYNMIKKNRSLLKIEMETLELNKSDIVEILTALAYNSTLNDMLIMNRMNHSVNELLRDYLIYNYSLTEFWIAGFPSPYNTRNSEFINDYILIPQFFNDIFIHYK